MPPIWTSCRSSSTRRKSRSRNGRPRKLEAPQNKGVAVAELADLELAHRTGQCRGEPLGGLDDGGLVRFGAALNRVRLRVAALAQAGDAPIWKLAVSLDRGPAALADRNPPPGAACSLGTGDRCGILDLEKCR